MAVQPRLIYEFDDFQLEPDERRLVRRGQAIPLPGKAFEILVVLIRNRGRLLTKDELFHLVWPDQVVEESNLSVNMSAIRRALGERANSPRYITTVSGYGYRFNGEVRQLVDETLTIERESFARVVVEEESSTTLRPLAGALANAARRATAHPILILGTLTIVLACVVGLVVRSFHRTVASAPWTNVTMRRFPTPGGVPFRAVISPDGKSIVYRQRINGKESFWLGQIDSNSSVKIGEPAGTWMSSIALSPDAAQLFVTERERAASSGRLLRMPIVGGVMSDVLSNIDSPVSFSPNGKQIAFLRRDDERRPSIVTADVDGRNQRTLLAPGSTLAIGGIALAWSPDGKSIAFAGSEGNGGRATLMTVRISDAGVSRVARFDWGQIGNMAWMPDGAGLAVAAFANPVTRQCQVWYVSYPAGEVRKLSNDLDIYLPETISVSRNGTIAVLRGHNTYEIWVAPDGDVKRAHLALQGVEPRYEGVDGLAWTPDGAVIYSAYVGDGQSIWKINSDGSNLQQLTTNNANAVDREVSATADGRYLVFESNRSGSFQIWRANSDGSNLKQLTSAGTNSQGSVSPDSRWIVYTSYLSGKATIWRISIDGGPPLQLTEGDSSWPEVSPNGEFIAYWQAFTSQHGLLAVMPFAGGPPVKTFELPKTTYLAYRLRWTPDSKSVMYRDAVQGLWQQPLNQAQPSMVSGFENLVISQFNWSRDGKNLVYNRGAIMREIILLQNSQ
jgi:Tol biopolymer transport system component/DNA-binding winged helix-turn-helix (wHTH) protein